MNKEKLSQLSNEIEIIASHFEEKPWSDNVKLLKQTFDISDAASPNHYLNVLVELEEITRQTRLLFVLTVLEKVCLEEGKIYNFITPYTANMLYKGVFKKDGDFYLMDEDGDFRDVFTSEEFVRFIDDEYWELYE